MEKISVKLSLVKETVNTYVYSYDVKGAAGKPPAVRTLYIEKWALGDNPPKTVTVSLE